MRKIDQWYIDLRDYAYLSEKKTNGELFGEVRYSGRLLVIFGIYYVFIVGGILYTIRAFYYIPLIKVLSNSPNLTKIIMSLLTVYLPFRIMYYFLERAYSHIRLPSDAILAEEYNRKRRVYWTTFTVGVLLIILLVFITVRIGSVVDGPIF